ncbi:DUF3219 family protein [Saccharibacillus sp. JS10]|uniref:DUF3219 family protein n=1 Tax=Saccharibacillus sp. JS10 TaxID=2950552 RepID=UPI00210AD753|nr:DUF3219 family protein [Saccharibacillus sp. JS10]MCQ4085364.1 YkvR family protein [Saccharibacillus sp. JS10]
MNTEVQIDERIFAVTDLRQFTVERSDGQEQQIFSFDFKVTHEEYHDVATLLYKGSFRLQIPQLHVDCEADIYNYSTSLDNLYEKGAIGDYHLELAKKI